MSLLVTAEITGQEIRAELFVVYDGSHTLFKRVIRPLRAHESSSSIYDSEIIALRFAGSAFREHFSINNYEIRAPKYLTKNFTDQLNSILCPVEKRSFHKSFFAFILFLLSGQL